MSAIVWASQRPEERLIQPKSWTESKHDRFIFLTFKDDELVRYNYMNYDYEYMGLHVDWLKEEFTCVTKDEIAEEMQELRTDNPTAFFGLMSEYED